MSADPWDEYLYVALADPAGLSAGHRHLQALGGLRGELNNGGFDQYFFNSAGNLAPIALEAAEEAGATELASLIRQALKMLNVADPTNRAARQEALERLDDEAFEQLDEAFYALEETADLDGLMLSVIPGWGSAPFQPAILAVHVTCPIGRSSGASHVT